MSLIAACAGASTSASEPWLSEFEPLEVVELIQDVPDSLKLAAIQASFLPVSAGRCPRIRPIRVDLTYEGPDRSGSRLTAEVRCAWRTTGAMVPRTLRVVGDSTASLRIEEVDTDKSDPAPVQVGESVPAATVGSSRAADLPAQKTPIRLITMVRPQISRGQLQMKQLGEYAVHVCIRRDGTVGKLRASAASRDPRLDAAVLDATRRWRFEPARLRGTPIPVCELFGVRLI